MSQLPPRRPQPDAPPSQTQTPGARKKSSGNKKLLIVLGVLGGGLLLVLLYSGLLLPAARETRFENNLKLVGLGAFNFHDRYQQFPPLPAEGPTGPRPRKQYALREGPPRDTPTPLSFQTAILPFMGQQKLYQSIDQSAAWDDPANRRAYQVVVPKFLSPHFGQKTTASGMGGAYLVSNSRMVTDEGGVRVRDVTDGTANTILAGGIDDASVPAWGDPNNGRDPANGFGGEAKAFGGSSRGGAQMLFCDGSVRLINADTDPEVARRLAMPDDGEAQGGPAH